MFFRLLMQRVRAAETPQDIKGVAERARVRDRRSRRDDARVVADNVRNRERDRRGACARRQPPALDLRQMFAYGVERVDVGALASRDDGKEIDDQRVEDAGAESTYGVVTKISAQLALGIGHSRLS